jgi:hypothetical protein
MGNQIASAALMRGWDYAFAVAEEQVNKGFRIAYEGGNVGTALNALSKERFTIDLGNGKSLTAAFGCPSVKVRDKSLDQCDIVIPLLDGAISIEGERAALRPGIPLRLDAALSLVRTVVKAAGKGETAGDAVHHEAIVKLTEDESIYKAQLGEGAEIQRYGEFAIAIKHKLQGMKRKDGSILTIAGFDVPAEENPYVPNRVDLGVVQDAGAKGRNVLVFAASIDPKGSEDKARLAFDAGILPVDLPAALWVGPEVMLNRLMLPLLKESLRNGANGPNLSFIRKDGTIALAGQYALPVINGRQPLLEVFTVRGASGGSGSMTLESRVRVNQACACTNAIAYVNGHIAFNLSPDRSSIVASETVDGNRVETEDTTPGWMKFLKFFGGRPDPFEACERAIYTEAIWRQLGGGSAAQMKGKLESAITKINGSMRIPSFSDAIAGGHLVFERVAFLEGGAAFLGIRSTVPAKPRA